jgi:tetratricopeptide (TPR) repeat protein
VPRRRSDLPYLFGEAADLRIIEDTTIESVECELRKDCNFTWALDLTLISLDSELEDDIRKEALEELEHLFADDTTVIRVENVLYSKPLPEEADLNGALRLCNSEPTAEFLRRLESHQPSIASVNQLWESIPSKTFGSHDNRSAFKHIAVKEGLFRDLVILDTPASVSALLLKAGLKQSVQRLPNHRQVLQAWSAPFRQSHKTPNIIKEEVEQTGPEERSFGKRRIDRRAVLQEATKRKSVITKAMSRRDLARVQVLTDELVAYQQRYSESRHTAKSLCDLAMEAKALGMNSLQLALTERSISVAPGDGWSWAQYADALLGIGRLDDAFKAYEQAERFGAGVIAKTGRAGVLKAQGQFDRALAAFDEVIEEHPENTVAKNGRAEVLKSQGRFADALAAFDVVIEQHPDDVVAKSGRAEVLKAQGRFADALAAFDEVIEQHPDDIVAKNGRAEVLKAQGRFVDALAAFDEVIEQYPENVVAKTGRAEILKAQGRFADALAAFDKVIEEHPENTVAKNGRAEVLKSQGRFADALAAFDVVIEQHSDDVVAKSGRAEVLKAQGRFADALAAFDEVIEQHPDDVVAKNGRAEVLRIQGQLQDALAAFDEIIKLVPEDEVARTGRSCVLLELNRYEEALESLPTDTPVSMDDWINHHIRGMILLRLGKTTEAIKIFNDGLQNSPFPSTKQYFQGALALSWLRSRDFRKAGEALDAVTSPILQPSANVIRIHAFGAQGNRQRALQAYENLKATPHLLTDELTRELYRQYVLEQNSTKDEEWVFDREVRILLRAEAA